MLYFVGGDIHRFFPVLSFTSKYRFYEPIPGDVILPISWGTCSTIKPFLIHVPAKCRPTDLTSRVYRVTFRRRQLALRRTPFVTNRGQFGLHFSPPSWKNISTSGKSAIALFHWLVVLSSRCGRWTRNPPVVPVIFPPVIFKRNDYNNRLFSIPGARRNHRADKRRVLDLTFAVIAGK